MVHVDDGVEALRAAEALKPDLVLLDVEIGGDLDGWGVLSELRGGEATKELPVVVTSTVENRAHAQRLGASDYLTKPFPRTALLDVLDRFAPAVAPTVTHDVLVIDDDSLARDLLVRWLESAHYRVRTAVNGDAALRELATRVPDLLFLDLLMPHTDGFQVLESVRTAWATRELPVIVVGAKTLGPTASAWLNSRAFAVLTKSTFHADHLLELARAALAEAGPRRGVVAPELAPEEKAAGARAAPADALVRR